jgi:hypothetical protein
MTEETNFSSATVWSTFPPCFVEQLLKLYLSVARAGFGQQADWSRSTDDGKESELRSLPTGHTMSFTDSFQYVALNVSKISKFHFREPETLRNGQFMVL